MITTMTVVADNKVDVDKPLYVSLRRDVMSRLSWYWACTNACRTYVISYTRRQTL